MHPTLICKDIPLPKNTCILAVCAATYSSLLLLLGVFLCLGVVNTGETAAAIEFMLWGFSKQKKKIPPPPKKNNDNADTD